MSKHLRHLLIPSLLLGASLPAFSATVGADEARSIATEFMNARGKGLRAEASLRPVYQAGPDSAPLYYVFNFPAGGFVIVSGDDSTNPVLGYSLEGSYDHQKLPGAMRWVMEGLGREIAEAPRIQNPLSGDERRRMARRAAVPAEEHLLPTAKWSQEAPFNSMIPGRPLVGCVGTAMATIMKYYQWPAAGNGSFGDVDFGVSYDWDSMRTDNYRSGYSQTEGDAVALLMYHASKSIDTQYAMSGSSAYEVRVPGALSNYFGYDPGVSYKKRSEVATQEAWDAIVKGEIDEGRPVLYCGQDVTAGHAFVCDGYQGEYLHFNWGWGGSADGYFLSTALNPTVSRTHHYNNLNTIIYNIKPASGEVAGWSPIHITSDGNQPGIGSDLTDLSSGASFTLRVGNLKNLSYSDFKGSIAVALSTADGRMKALLSAPSSLSLQSMGYLFDGYKDFRNCALPAGTSVEAGDKVRLMTRAEGATEWLPVAGELPTLNELSPAPGVPASFKVTLPAAAGVTLEGEPKVIRGWNYTFKAIPQNPAEDVVTVKANGLVLTPGANNSYTIANVREDQEVTLLVQKASEVREKRSVWVETPGTLSAVLKEEDAAAVKDLTIFGSIDARDFAYIKSATRLSRLDLSGAYISANGSNQANAIPREAFRGIGSLKEVVLPASVNRLNNGCFRQCGITSITIPAGVKTYEYNVFCSAGSLRHIYVGRQNAEFINWCVLAGVNTKALTLHVPNEAALASYSKAENWKDIANIIVDPIQSSDEALFAVMEDGEVQFECDTPAGQLAKGSVISFKARHIADNDNRMEVYANSSLLTPDANGTYTATLAGNTMIHFGLVAPEEVNPVKSPWTLNAKNGSVGMLTDAVNLLPGQDFTVRVNALSIPAGYEQFYWGMALTDASGRIKEMISPVTVWSAGAAENHKFNVTCRVNSSDVREGNMVRLVTSANKKLWSLVEGADETIVAALPALNNVTPVYTITVPEVKGATVTGAVTSAVRGRDITIKVLPNSQAHHIDMTVNGKEVLKDVASVNYTFVAMEDMEFGFKVYDPKEEGAVVYNVASGELSKKVTTQNIRPNVIVTGETTASDLSLTFSQVFAQKTVKKLDLSGLKIVAGGGYDANTLPSEMFYKSSTIGSVVPVLQEIIMPASVVRIAEAAFKNCANIKEITLPDSLAASRIQVGTYASGSPKYGFGIGYQAFQGCTSLTTIRIPGKPAVVNGKQIVAHHDPYGVYQPSFFQYPNYNLGHADAKKVTVIVPEEYLSVYRTANSDQYNGNPWKGHGYNILSEYPVYGVTYDPARVGVAEDVDVARMASFLGDNVSLAQAVVEGKVKLLDPEARCRVFDNGEEVTPSAEGTIDVTFYNPAKNAALAGNHRIDVVYTRDVTFNSASDLFKVSEPEVVNSAGYEFSEFNADDPVKHILSGVAENSEVRFRVGFASEHESGLEVRVMAGIEELVADAEGYYSLAVTNADRAIDIFAVPGEGAVLNAEELASINPEESAAVTSIALAGEMSAEDLAHAVECFPALETLDLSRLEGELPEGLFSGMETLETVVLPEVETIPANMFSGCSSLTSVESPAAINEIGEGAFKDCSALETLRLTGVSSIGAGAFAGCGNLTTITLLADVAGDAAGVAARSPRRAAGIDDHAFDGLNPNCIILLDEGVATPSASANYLHTATGTVTETLPDGSVTEREGRVYSAQSPLAFTAGYPLAIPHAFTIAEGAGVSLDAELEGWTGLVVPFDVEKVSMDGGKEADFASDEKDAPMAYTLPENGENLERTKSIAANVPVMVRVADGKATFSSASGDVPATPASVAVAGKDYTLCAAYTRRELPASETYILNQDSSAFIPAGDDDQTVTIDPFALYATAPEALQYIETRLPGTDGPTVGVEEGVAIADGLRVVRDGNILVIFSDRDRTESVFDASGRLVRILTLGEGRNEVELPGAGVWFIGSAKLIF